MEQIRKTYFDPLATTKAQIHEILENLPVGSAHPFSPEKILLWRTEKGVEEIDISSFPEDYFFNAVDLGAMGEILLTRMAGFKQHLGVFEDFQIQQAPASTFKIPIVSDQITILAVSTRNPTYYDFCFADADDNACCWLARTTFKGITHSGDILHGQDLLDYVKINSDTLTDKEICVFISGYQSTHITKFLGTSPALLVADHIAKVLYIVPVPLDAATIGDATICCPLVIKRDGTSLICSILPKATTDRNMMCHSEKMNTPCFREAIKCADFTINTATPTAIQAPKTISVVETSTKLEYLDEITANSTAVLITNKTAVPSFLSEAQIIEFGNGLEFKVTSGISEPRDSSVVLPCIFGSQLEGPILLATGVVPSNVPFISEHALREYYAQLKNVVVVTNDHMTDNARNLAGSYRINALFIVVLSPEKAPKDSDEIIALLNSANINAVTALAGPQSLVLVQIAEKYYFYRGIANQTILDTTSLAFGSDVTSVVDSAGNNSLLDPRATRIVNLNDENTIILPSTGQLVKPNDLKKLFEDLPIDQIHDLEKDISAAIPQLQLLLNQQDLQALSQSLVSTLSSKVNNVTAPLRKKYIKFLTQEYRMDDPKLVRMKNDMLGDLRKNTKDLQKTLESAISNLANMMSSQTTSKRTHDLQRLVRQAAIQGNVALAQSMTFETLAGYLETHASEMGVMLLNIDTTPYQQLLGKLKTDLIDAGPCCDLDSRVLHLEGFDAGIIIEQSQNSHNGPLANQSGPMQPILALPYLSQGLGSGSMLAWVCWDEFVELKNPYTVRWMEKCNDGHIAALRIIMRSTLSQAISSREHNFQSSSPEIGHLMSALLMAAMGKLAAMRTSAPTVTREAEDSVTKLMRGLFGNLLTIAGSGVRPMSMVWQLFGLNPQYDVPAANVDWIWYETVVALYPYTGWPLKQFYGNLEKLLDKVIVRVVTKNENMAAVKMNRTAEMIKYCKLRNIQLDQSRTIITIFMKMLTEREIDIAAVATRLLEQVPHSLERQTQSYTAMIKYLEHLAKGGQRRQTDDLFAASVYTKRSAAFAGLKSQISEACGTNDWETMKKSCQAILDKHAEIAALWKVKPAALKIQNLEVYKKLITAEFGEDVEPETKTRNLELTRQALGDAEKGRVPWQVGKPGQFGDKIEPLDEGFVLEILTGGKPEPTDAMDVDALSEAAETAIIITPPKYDFTSYSDSLQASFITSMQKKLSADDVCDLLKVPTSAMRVFIKALNPEGAEAVWENLGENFKGVILGLMKDRSGRAESRPVRKLFVLKEVEKIEETPAAVVVPQIEGQGVGVGN